MKRFGIALALMTVSVGLSALPAAATVTVTIDSPTDGATPSAPYTDTMSATFTFVSGDSAASYTLEIVNTDTNQVVTSSQVQIDPATDSSPMPETLDFGPLGPGNYAAEVYDSTQALMASNQFVVEHPTASIGFPAAGATVDPVGAWTLTMEIRRSGIRVWSKDVSAASNPVKAAFPKLRDGSYVARAIDQWGHRLGTVSFTVKNLSITGADTAPDPFYPLVRDGYRDTTRLTWVQSLSGKATVTIRNHGALALGPRGAGQHYWVWNGSTPGGNSLRAGTYYLQVAVVDQYGVRARSPWVAVHIATGWRKVSRTTAQAGNSADGSKIWHKPCGFLRNYFQRGDAVVVCDTGGKAALFYRFTVPGTVVSARVWFTVRANSTSGKIFSGLLRPNATHLLGYIGVSGRRILEILKATLTYTYKKRI
jgi:hypothetical protein